MQYTIMSDTLKKLELEFNPFEPSASGVPLGSKLVLPTPLGLGRALFLTAIRPDAE